MWTYAHICIVWVKPFFPLFVREDYLFLAANKKSHVRTQ